MDAPNPARVLAQALQLAAGRRGGAPPSPTITGAADAAGTTAGHDGDAPSPAGYAAPGASDEFYAAADTRMMATLDAIFADADAADAAAGDA